MMHMSYTYDNFSSKECMHQRQPPMAKRFWRVSWLRFFPMDLIERLSLLIASIFPKRGAWNRVRRFGYLWIVSFMHTVLKAHLT